MDSLPKILQQSNTKRIYTTITHVNHISHNITTKNKETCNNTKQPQYSHTSGRQETDYNSMTLSYLLHTQLLISKMN